MTLLASTLATIVVANPAMSGEAALEMRFLQAPPAQTASGPKPLRRHTPLLYDTKLEYIVSGFPRSTGPAITVQDFAFVIPVILSGPTSRIDPRSMKPQLWFDSRQDKSVSQRAHIVPDKHLGANWAVIPIGTFSGSAMRIVVEFRGQSWSTVVDEGLMARVAWPREWPKETADALKPQTGIESEAPIIKALVTKTLGENARMMPPYHAAKEIIRAATLAYRAVNSDTLEKRGMGRIVGMRVVGARDTLDDARGTPHDVVCTCVAALRAAGIPARPVIGVRELSRGAARLSTNDRVNFVSWGEFWLPDAGWVPFDPELLRGNAVRQLKPFDKWPGVGTIPELNQRMPIAWSFAPEGLPLPRFPALFSFQGSLSFDANSLETYVGFTIIARGKGVEDP